MGGIIRLAHQDALCTGLGNTFLNPFLNLTLKPARTTSQFNRLWKQTFLNQLVKPFIAAPGKFHNECHINHFITEQAAGCICHDCFSLS